MIFLKSPKIVLTISFYRNRSTRLKGYHANCCVMTNRLQVFSAQSENHSERYGQNNFRSFEKKYFNFASTFWSGSQVWDRILWKTLPYSKDIDLFHQIKKIEIRFRSCRSREWEIHDRGFWQFRRFLDKNSSKSILFCQAIEKRTFAFNFSSSIYINKIIKLTCKIKHLEIDWTSDAAQPMGLCEFLKSYFWELFFDLSILLFYLYNEPTRNRMQLSVFR